VICDLHQAEFSFDIIGVSEVFRADRDPRIILPQYQNIKTRRKNDDHIAGVGLLS